MPQLHTSKYMSMQLQFLQISNELFLLTEGVCVDGPLPMLVVSLEKLGLVAA